MLFKEWGAFLYYKIFVHKFFLAMCTCAQKLLGRVHMRIRVVTGEHKKSLQVTTNYEWTLESEAHVGFRA